MPQHQETVEELLDRQHGVLSRAQAERHGISARTVAGHIRSRRWQRVYEGVYATFTGPLPFHSRVWAALLYAGRDAVASHETAAVLWGLAPVSPNGADEAAHSLIHVTIPADRRVAPQPGLCVHLSHRAVDARHPVVLPPRTKVEETAFDLAASAASLDGALAVLARACGRRLTTAERLLEAAAGRRRLRWRKVIERALADIGDGAHSLLELRYRQRVEQAHGLPRGQAQHAWRDGGGQRYSDVRYEKYRTRVELDGRIGHTEDARFRDMRRDNAGTVAGDGTLRYGWADVEARNCETAGQVITVLRGRGWRGTPRRCGPNCRLPSALS
jgi:hypothetical protein